MNQPHGNSVGAEPLGPEAASRIVAMLQEADPHEESASEAGDLPAFPGYRTIRRLGAGGGGTVYLACREGSDRPVALKVINRPPSAADPGARRAWRELEFLSQLHLPSIPRVIDYTHAGGQLLIATEYIDGLPLSRHCEHGQSQPLDRRARVTLLARIADAVHALHEHGVMHRDLKPSNILIDCHGDPIIIDLGIAALLTDDVMHTLTDDGVPIGSPAFMAPEQARGERSRMSTRTDVYGLGAAACYILTGHTPHDTETTLHTALHRIANEDPRDPLTLDPTLPRPLAAILAKATARNPESRYDSAAAFAADLRRWLAGEPVSAVTPGLGTRALRWVARRPVLSTAIACSATAAAILLGAIASAWWLNQRPHNIELKDDGSAAYLRTMNGRILARWGLGEPGSVVAADLLDRPRSLGGGQVVLICARGKPEQGGTDAQLSVFSIDDLSTPLWTASATGPGIQVPPGGTWRSEFYVSRAFAADIFPESPGSELVAVHGQGRSPFAIRIYDLAGTVLYEAWHLGTIHDLEWMATDRVLVASACRHGRPAEAWEEIGYVLNTGTKWPRLLFGLRPEYGKRYTDGWINGIDNYPRSEAALLWYRYIMPKDQQPEYVDLAPSLRPLNPHAIEVELGYGLRGQGLSLHRLLDARGEFIPDTEIIGDPYRRKLLATRPTEVYTLVDAEEVCGLEVAR